MIDVMWLEKFYLVFSFGKLKSNCYIFEIKGIWFDYINFFLFFNVLRCFFLLILYFLIENKILLIFFICFVIIYFKIGFDRVFLIYMRYVYVKKK